MSDDVETPARPRTSRFREHTNTASSIKPPPDELWKDLSIENMIEKFNEENTAPPTRKGKSITPPSFGVPGVVSSGTGSSAAPTAPTTSDGPLSRISRAWASVFGNFSVLGKRKAGNADAEKGKDKEKQVLEERKHAADQAYQARKLAQEQGLLPTPKVFIRPTATPRSHKCVVENGSFSSSPRTPGLYRTPSKKDLQKQKRLSKRVSDLEYKLASARKELQTVLHKDLPPVPPVPNLNAGNSANTSVIASSPAGPALDPTSSTPETSQEPQIFSDKENEQDTQSTSPSFSQTSVGKIVKKRKATSSDNDSTYIPVTTDSEGDIDISTSEPERTVKRAKSTSAKKLRRKKARALKKAAARDARRQDDVIRVVPDGRTVPPLPEIPSGIEGKKVVVRDDGYGGLEHEMF